MNIILCPPRSSYGSANLANAKPDSYIWSPANVGGVNDVRLTASCAHGDAPDRIVYQAWSWELTSAKAWVDSLEATLAMFPSM